MSSNKRKYRVAVDFSVCGEIEVEASSLGEAMELADDMELPNDTTYIDGSFNVNEETTRFFAHDDFNETCAICGRSVRQGSGLFVDRIAIADEYEQRKDIYNYPEGEFICRECYESF